MRGRVAPDAASFEYLVKTKCAAFDARGAWAAHAEMEREYLDATPQALAALATVSSITGDVASAEKACVMAKAAIEANGAGVVAPSGDGARGTASSARGWTTTRTARRTTTRRAPAISSRRRVLLRSGTKTVPTTEP